MAEVAPPITLEPIPPVSNPPVTVLPGVTTPPMLLPSPTSTAPGTPAPAGSTLVALNPDHQPTGPPGVGLAVSGAGYQDCKSVYIFIDGVRVGTIHPNASGAIDGGGLSVPGDISPGTHQVVSACEPSGGSARATATFVVTPSSSHRSAFVTSLNEPRHVALRATSLLTSAVVALLFLLLLAFPSELFNTTLEENYDEVRSWFGLGPRQPDAASQGRSTLTFLAFILAGGVVYALLSPGFGLNMATLALVVGLTVALVVMTLLFSVPADLFIHRRTGEWGRPNILPGSLVVALVCVGISRLLNFQPGYLYGVLAGLAFRSKLDEPAVGKATAENWTFALAGSVLAWIARVPVSAAAAKPHASAWLYGLEACLAAIFLIGIESLVVAMLPMRFLDGRKIMTWSRILWGFLLTLGLFAVVQVLLTPGSGYVGHTTDAVRWSVAALYVAFGLISFSFWGYFRFRPARWAPAEAEGIQFEGDR